MRKAFTLLYMALVMLAGGQTVPAYLPNPSLTPGAINPALTKEVICANGWSTKSVRGTTAKVKNAVYRAYGIKTHKAGQYEIDHLCSLEIGGADVQSNLWPQSYTGAWNAHIKDELENTLHREVCSGKSDLATVQAEIKTNWIDCYKKHIGDPTHNKAWPTGVKP